uniref:Uncharacterized protein n=1 Tax=Panagrolaimus sp. ES5 TaxID=591445 RepID=A0AC34GIV3_9BILA
MDPFFPKSQPKDKHEFTRRRYALDLKAMKNLLIPKLIKHMKESYAEDAEFVKDVSALHPSNLPAGTNTLREYSQKLTNIAGRFGGSSARIIDEFIDVMRHLITKDDQNYFANIYLPAADFWRYAMEEVKGQIEVNDFKPFIEKVLTLAP